MRPLRRILGLATLALGLAGAVPRVADAHSLPWLLSLPLETLLTIRIRHPGEHLPPMPPAAARKTGGVSAR